MAAATAAEKGATGDVIGALGTFEGISGSF